MTREILTTGILHNKGGIIQEDNDRWDLFLRGYCLMDIFQGMMPANVTFQQ